MDKYEYNLRAEQIVKLVGEGDYVTAAKISDTIDWRRVRNINMLVTVAETYEACGRNGDAKEILIMAYEKAPIGRRLAYRLTELCIKSEEYEDAKKYYEDFVNLSPKDNRRFELLYEINRRQGASIEVLIAILEEYKKHDMDEYWGYELARNYYMAGMYESCVKQCDELFLWFGEGEAVVKALELKEILVPLTEKQLIVKNTGYAPTVAQEEQAATPKEKVEEKPRPVNAKKKGKVRKKAEAEAARRLQKAEQKKREAEKQKTAETVNTVAVEETVDTEDTRTTYSEVPQETIRIDKICEDVQVKEAVVVEEPVQEEPIAISEPEEATAPYFDDDQIEGQMTLEEVLAMYDVGFPKEEPQEEAIESVTEEATEPVVEETEEVAEAYVEEPENAVDKAQEEAYKPMYESEPQPVAEIGPTIQFEPLEVEEDNIDQISEAVSKVTDEMIEQTGKDWDFEGGLTYDQRKTFKKFLYMRGMEEQLTSLFQGVAARNMVDFRSVEGNLLIVGEYKSGKTTLAISIIKEINAIRGRQNRRIAKISGERLNNKGIRETLSQLSDSDLLIEHVGRMSKGTLQGLLSFMTGPTGGMLVVFEDTKEAIEYIFAQVPEARTFFNYYVELREVEIAEWVEIAKSYCKELGYKLDDMAKLALSARISRISTDDFSIEFEDVKEIVDEAIKKYNRKHFFKKRNAEDSGAKVLKEADFK